MQGTIITNKGLRLITKLVASQGTLTFTRAAVGTGKVPEGYDPAGMTDLSHFQMDGKISSYRATGDIAAIVFQVQSVGITQGFTITEAGIYADDPDEGEVLYAYLDMSEDPQYIYAENSAVSKFVEMTLETVVGRVEKITAAINPYHLITREGDISDTVVETMEPSIVEFPEPSAGEKTGVIFGKIKKCIADFKAMKNTFVTLSHLVNDGLTTEPGYAADARQLNPTLQGTLAAQVAKLNSDLAYYKLSDSHVDIRSALPYTTPTRGILLVAGHSVAESIYKGITALDVYVDGINFKTPPCTIANAANLTATTAAIFPLAAGSRITKVGSEYSVVDKIYFYPKA